MNKLNNSGMTLVELLVTFSLVMIIAIGIFNLVLEVRSDLDEKGIIRDFTEYSNNINNKIHYDLIKNKPFVITYKNNISDNWVCKYIDNNNCIITNDILSVSYKGKAANSDLLSYTCNMYPCAIYGYFDENNSIAFKTISISDKYSANKKYGIKYNNTFESIPNVDKVEMNAQDSKIQIDDKNFFIIDFSFHVKGNDKNLGFKIAYPFIELS